MRDNSLFKVHPDLTAGSRQWAEQPPLWILPPVSLLLTTCGSDIIQINCVPHRYQSLSWILMATLPINLRGSWIWGEGITGAGIEGKRYGYYRLLMNFWMSLDLPQVCLGLHMLLWTVHLQQALGGSVALPNATVPGLQDKATYINCENTSARARQHEPNILHKKAKQSLRTWLCKSFGYKHILLIEYTRQFEEKINIWIITTF